MSEQILLCERFREKENVVPLVRLYSPAVPCSAKLSTPLRVIHPMVSALLTQTIAPINPPSCPNPVIPECFCRGSSFAAVILAKVFRESSVTLTLWIPANPMRE